MGETSPRYAQAVQLYQQGSFSEAVEVSRALLKQAPNHQDALYLLSAALIQSGKAEDAINPLEQYLSVCPNDSSALSNLAFCLNNSGRHKEAKTTAQKALERDHNCPHGWSNLGVAQQALGQLTDAEISHSKSSSLDPGNPLHLYNLGNVLFALTRYGEAAESFKRCVEINPAFLGAHINLSATYLELALPEKASLEAQKALKINPTSVDALKNLGTALFESYNFDEAIVQYQKASTLTEDQPDIWYLLGKVANRLGRVEDACSYYDRAIQLKPDYFDAWVGKGLVLSEQNKAEGAASCFEKALSYNPKATYLIGTALHSRMQSFSWGQYASGLKKIEGLLHSGDYSANPLQALGLFESPELQMKSAESYVKKLSSKITTSPYIFEDLKKPKIRIAYLSADFGEHPVSYLMSEVFGFHDRSSFEVLGISTRKNPGGDFYQKIKATFDEFYDLGSQPDSKVVDFCRNLRIDICVDLGGYTKDARPEIFLHRVSPIQMSYIGFPGTLALPNMDYMIADSVLVTPENRPFITEKIIYLPGHFQANPSSRPIGGGPVTEKDFGTTNKVIFCAFNNCWKVTPEIFDCWIEILLKVPQSSLWVLVNDSVGQKNFTAEGERRGVPRDRFVFFGRTTRETYLNRLQQADIFLDTFPYNAGTTASDALWAGTPVVTFKGKSIASRMAASLLTHSGLPDLVTHGRQEYIETAVALARSPERLGQISKDLLTKRGTDPLFRPDLFAKKLDAAFKAVFQNFKSGHLPVDIHIDNVD
jgi:protein O-GlcNAc transferase